MLEIVDQFREKGTLDELGFGSIRDSFADLFFPGISTIQTRARYLLFVPWIYADIEKAGLPFAQVDARARRDQARLAAALQQGGEGESQGVIGIAAGEALVRTPAEIYWGALGRFKVWRYQGSLAQYYGAIRKVGGLRSTVRSDDGELVEQTGIVGWHRDLPPAPDGLLESTTLSLSRPEADYLRERIAVEAPGTLLARCIDGGRRLGAIDYPWQHPNFHSFPKTLQREIEHAQRFSIVAFGAVLLYNLMLAEKAEELELGVAEGLVEQRREEMQAWAKEVADTGHFIAKWPIDDFWATVLTQKHRVGYPTRQFVDAIIALAQDAPATLAQNHVARRMLTNRELSLKGGLARLTNRRALERYSGSAGLSRMNYRWPNVKQIVRDIQQGLGRSDPAVPSNA